MNVTVLNEAGYDEAMRGLSLSYLQPVERMPKVAPKLVLKGEPHCKFLRQMVVWIEVTAPWKWWKQLVEYRIGIAWDIESQSSSTMHTLMKRRLTQDDFERPIQQEVIDVVNFYIDANDLHGATDHLPGAFLYTRVLMVSYSALRSILSQRLMHRLPEWQDFIHQIVPQVQHPEFLEDLLGDKR